MNLVTMLSCTRPTRFEYFCTATEVAAIPIGEAVEIMDKKLEKTPSVA